MRPGCDRAAEARLSYDAIGCQVWLDELAERPGRTQEICGLHAGRLTVPRGWMLCDRRDDQPALFVAAAQPAPVAVAPVTPLPPVVGRPGRRRRAEATRHPAATLELFADPLIEAVVDAEPVVEPEPVAEPAAVDPQPAEPEPVVEPAAAVDPEPAEPEHAGPSADEDDVPEMLRATSPLLARAFAATGHQRSVLTQRTDDPDNTAD